MHKLLTIFSFHYQIFAKVLLISENVLSTFDLFKFLVSIKLIIASSGINYISFF